MSVRRLILTVALGAIALVLLYRVLSIYEVRGGECIAPPESRITTPMYPRRLVVMTYNIEGHAELLREDHIRKIAEVIKALRPDVVGLEEVHRNTWQSRFKDQIERLRVLTGMNAVFGESYEQFGGQFGNAILTRGEIVSTDVFKLPGTGEPRTLLSALIRIDGAEIDFFVTHLTAWERINSPVRADQLACIARHMRVTRRAHILVGDFNAPPQLAEVIDFRRQGMRLAGEDIGPTQKTLNERIDYIFADPGWTIGTARAIDTGPSDHKPVIAELSHDGTK